MRVTKLFIMIMCAILVLALSGCPSPSEGSNPASDSIPVHTHSWDAGEVTAQPTLLTDGVKTFHCTHEGCTETKTEFIPALFSVPSDAEGTPVTASYTGDVVYFGFFPQTVVSQSESDGIVTLYQEDGETELVLTEEKIYCGGNEYIKGNDGNYYFRAAEIFDRDNYAAETYSDGTETQQLWSTRYFRVEPLEWKVCGKYNGTDAVLLVSAKALKGKLPFYDLDSYPTYYPDWRTADGLEDEISPSDYSYSQIRAWLLGTELCLDTTDEGKRTDNVYKDKGFLQQAFTQKAQERIENTSLSDELITDKVFLLSKDEVESIFTTAESRKRSTTDYAKATNAVSESNASTEWYLRSRQENSNWIYRILSDGRIYSRTIIEDQLGVVPALTVKLGE